MAGFQAESLRPKDRWFDEWINAFTTLGCVQNHMVAWPQFEQAVNEDGMDGGLVQSMQGLAHAHLSVASRTCR